MRRAARLALLVLPGLNGLLTPCAVAWAQPVPVETAFALQTRLEPLRLPGGERMGLWTQSWLLAHEGWWLGPTVAAAATGQRGGLFVLGAQVARRWAWTDEGPGAAGEQARNWLDTSLTVGGGGGAGAPVGGGLMLAPALSLLHDWGGWQTGVSWSRVKFPSGRIGSSQVGLVLQWDGRWRWWEAADVGRSRPALTNDGSDAERMRGGVLGWQSLQVDAAVRRQRQGARLGLAGARAERDGPGAWRWTLETAAATHGGADGYMEMLGGALWRWPLAGDSGDAEGAGFGRAPTLGLRAAVGLGGGGAVATGGGLIGKLAAQGRWPLAWGLPADWAAPLAGAHVQLEAGVVGGPGGRTGGDTAAGVASPGRYRATYAQASLGWDLDGQPTGGPRLIHGWRASASWQRETRAARKQGPAASLDTVGLKLATDDGGPLYLTAQAHSAVSGGAGAYWVGLMGVGCATASADWRVGAEALVGAAGGGGVASQGGAVGAAQLWVQWAAGHDTAWQLGVGRMRSLRSGLGGTLDTPVVDLSWTRRFGQ